MNKVKIGIIRPTLLDIQLMSIERQEIDLRSQGCTAFLRDDRFKLSANTHVVTRLDEIGLWDLCEKADCGEVIAVDSSRIIRKYEEVPTLLAHLSRYEFKLKFIRDEFASDKFPAVLNLLERMDYTAKTTQLEALKAGNMAYKRKAKDSRHNMFRTLAYARDICERIEKGKTIVDICIYKEISASWIYYKGLHREPVRCFFLGLSEEEIKNNSLDLHLQAQIINDEHMKKKKEESRFNCVSDTV